MATGRYTGRDNASEFGAPAQSTYGAALRRHVGQSTNRPAPVVGDGGMGLMVPNRVGVVATRSGRTSPVGAVPMYGGTLPLSVQPQLVKPRPWLAALAAINGAGK